MSKAFTKDNDGAPEEEIAPVHELPLTAKNYVTPQGLASLKDELKRLLDDDKPDLARQLSAAMAASLDLEIPPLKKRLRGLDARVHYLHERIRNAEVIDPAARRQDETRVFFGATVRFANGEGDERTVRIVGVDEAEASRGDISFVSPLAKALLGASEGDSVPFRAPGGNATGRSSSASARRGGAGELDILEVRY
jgi:transcription elongation factor GreB